MGVGYTLTHCYKIGTQHLFLGKIAGQAARNTIDLFITYQVVPSVYASRFAIFFAEITRARN